ncbi:unnamed protein product [Ceratitis capitata]|uniref:(Mediterranean fruit fly) hypothetical protein n=1 Tax=Ceratitis capitata TaxID=7213 RepID=A0A811UZX7_CERCA|nr:unnamed protein product [Ceratitis capitata]
MKTPCVSCIQFKEMIEKQTEFINEMMGNEKCLKESLENLQATTESQNRVIVEMMADHKLHLTTTNNGPLNISAITTLFPIKAEEDLKIMDADINSTNESKYISAVKYLFGGCAHKNLERIFSKELFVTYNTKGNFGKKGLRTYTEVYKVLLSAIGYNSPNAEKELRAGLQAVKRHFRFISNNKKNIIEQI